MSNERLEKTRNQFFLGDEGRDDSSRDRGRMKIICEQILFAADVRYDKGLALFEMVVEELLAGRIVGEGLDPKLMSALRRSHDAAKSLENEIDFEQLCLNSSTTWDQFLRDLTPDLPTFLSDFVFQVSSSTRAQARWVSLFDTLEPAELEAAIRWYRDKARSLGADVKELEIPAWIPQ